MPKGGAGKGQGRKPRLAEWDRLAVGIRCRQLWTEAWQKNREVAVSHQIRHDVESLWKTAQEIPVNRRPSWTRSEAFEDHQAEVRIAIHKARGVPPIPDDIHHPEYAKIEAVYESEPNRLVKVRRPKGVWRGIFEKVAQEFGVSQRMVERCWKEYRALEREMGDV